MQELLVGFLVTKNTEGTTRIKIGGFADGDYVCVCRRCGSRFIGDKRSLLCLECAVRTEVANAAERSFD